MIDLPGPLAAFQTLRLASQALWLASRCSQADWVATQFLRLAIIALWLASRTSRRSGWLQGPQAGLPGNRILFVVPSDALGPLPHNN